MSLNNIKLPLRLLADLYKDALTESHATDVPVSPEFRHLGNNAKNILVVVHNPEVAFLSDSDLNFLTSVLNACKLTLGDVAVVNRATQKITDYHDLIQHLESRTVLLCGISPSSFGLPVEFPPFQIQKFESQTYLCTPALNEMADNKTLKGQLWNSLKQIFSI
jgi:hypothetical protein